MAAIFIISYYLLTVLGLLLLKHKHLSGLSEQIVSLFMAPGILSLTLWNPVLRPLGLTDGELWVAPQWHVSLLIIGLYALIGFGVSKLLVRRFGKAST